MAGKEPTHKVLLIQRDRKQIEVYSDMIREVADCQVDVLSHAESSLDWVGRFNYQLVVIDHATVAAMPVGPAAPATDMLGLLEAIKRLSPATSVILLSDQATVENAVAAIRLGAEDFLKKPFNLESFRLAVKRGLDRKAVFGDNSNVAGYLNLLNSCQMISASLEQAKIFGIVQSYFSRELHSDHTVVFKLEGTTLSRVADPGNPRKDRAMEEILEIALHASNPLPKMAEGDELHRFVERGQLTPALFIFRFKCAGKAEYFCVCLSPERPSAPDSFESRLRMLRTQIEVTGKNIEQFLGVQHLVFVDDATGLYNTRYLYNILDREIANAQITKQSFAVLFIDCDRFKVINDSHGHLVGTKLLNELGAQLRKCVRGNDIVFRYGGDEFVAVLSASDLPTAQMVAERIRKSVESAVFLSQEGLNIRATISIGVALFPDHAGSKRAVIEAADHAMYSAKRATRNSVFIAPMAAATAPVTKIKGRTSA